MKEHSIFSPSRLKRIIACPASIPLEQVLFNNGKLKPQKPSIDAEHGSNLHDITHRVTPPFVTKRNILDTYDLSIDDKSYVQDCVDYLNRLIKAIGHNNYVVLSEHKVSLASWGISDVWGTSDKIILDMQRFHVDIIDWKFGFGAVLAEENEQLLAYAAGAIGVDSNIKTITLHVVQPPVNSYSTYDLTYFDLFEWVHKTLAIAVNNAKRTDIQAFNPGKEQCQWCPCALFCDARYTQVQAEASHLFEMQKFLPEHLTFEQINELISFGNDIQEAISMYTRSIMAQLSAGSSVPGWKLVRGKSNRRWKDETAAMSWLADNTKNIDQMFVTKFASPAQAEKLNKQLKANKDFQNLYEKPPGKISLAAESDPRPSISPDSNAESVFSKYGDPA